MKNIIIFLVLLVFSITYSSTVQAQMDPKVKTVAVMATYGTVGGALLGLSSLAFKSSPRAIPVGASLGLYAGLLFGSYIVVTHEMRKRGIYQEDNYYPDAPSTPYDGGSGGEQNSYEKTDEGAYRWDPTSFQNEYAYSDPRLRKENQQIFALNFFNYSF